jgi:hypothetical protein
MPHRTRRLRFNTFIDRTCCPETFSETNYRAAAYIPNYHGVNRRNCESQWPICGLTTFDQCKENSKFTMGQNIAV